MTEKLSKRLPMRLCEEGWHLDTVDLAHWLMELARKVEALDARMPAVEPHRQRIILTMPYELRRSDQEINDMLDACEEALPAGSCAETMAANVRALRREGIEDAIRWLLGHTNENPMEGWEADDAQVVE